MSRRLPHDQIIADYVAGESSVKIAKRYDADPSTIRSILRRNGVPRRPSRRLPHEQIIAEYLSGDSSYKIAARYLTDPSAICLILRRKGVPRRPPNSPGQNRIFTLDESVFDAVDESSAYWAGFICADGAVLRDNRDNRKKRLILYVGLSSHDTDHLLKLRAFIGSNHPLYNSRGVRNGKVCDGVRLRVSATRLCTSLARWGIVPNKTRRTMMPSFLPENMQAAFWRGVIDGDGSLGQHGRWNVANLKLTSSSVKLLEQFRQFVRRHCPQYGARIYSRGSYGIVWLTARIARTIIAVLYTDASVALDRKLARAQLILASHRP